MKQIALSLHSRRHLGYLPWWFASGQFVSYEGGTCRNGDILLPVFTQVRDWIRVGDLRRRLASRGISVSTPDAHVAQCALERGALLLSRDAVFVRIAEASELRVQAG